MRGHGRPKFALALAVLLLCTPTARAAPVTAVSLFGEAGDPVGGGLPHLLIAPGAALAVNGGPGSVYVNAEQGHLRWSLGFLAPEGQALQRGSYADATPVILREPGRPAIALYGPGVSCFAATGDFEIRDLAQAPDGTVARLWAIFAGRCDGNPSRIFGEIRVAEPTPAGPLAVLPGLVRFPGVPAGTATAAVPVTVFAARATRLRGLALSGRDAGAFRVVRDGCGRRVLPRGGACQAWIAFGSARPGRHVAALRIARRAGLRTRALRVPVEAVGFPGRTRLLADGEGHVELTAATAQITMEGHARAFRLTARPASGPAWHATFSAPDPMGPGHYAAATAPGSSVTGLDVGSEAQGCPGRRQGSFDIGEITYDPNRFVATVSLSFEQRCEATGSVLRGVVEYRAP